MFYKSYSYQLFRALTLLFLLVLVPYALLADQSKPENKESLDAVLIIDASGSMRITDPSKFRSEGARMFSQSLKDGDRLAILEFSDSTKTLRPLVDYNPTQETDLNFVINSVADNGEYTDIYSALKTAQELLKKTGRKDAEQVIILLSDGKLDPSPKNGTTSALTEKLLEELVPELRMADIKVYTLAFSEHADKELLAQISAGTNAIHWYTKTSEELNQSFTDLILAVKKPQLAPLTSKGFKIDEDIEEATFYINRQKDEVVTLITPSGEKIKSDSKVKGLKWFGSNQFDVITVKTPEAGQWQITGLPKNEGFATLLTNLKLTATWPSILMSGDTTILEVRLYESRKPVVLPEMTGVVKYAFQITPTDKVSEPIIREFLNDEGKSGDRIPRDGVFSSKVILEDAGEYKMRVLAVGPTFERNQQLEFRVKPRLVSLKVVPEEESLTYQAESQHNDNIKPKGEDYIQASLSMELAGSKKINLELFATDSDNRLYKIPLVKIDQVYEALAHKLPHDGEYKLKATLTAETKNNRKIRGESQEITYTKVKSSHSDSAVEVVVLEDKKIEPPKEAGFPFLYLIVLFIINGVVGYLGLNKFKKSKGLASEIVVKETNLSDTAVIQDLILKLEELANVTTVNLDDPLFTEDSGDFESDSFDNNTQSNDSSSSEDINNSENNVAGESENAESDSATEDNEQGVEE
jgi:uncharacterized protein (TIGR03503 family)